jgi:hypothetical protein
MAHKCRFIGPKADHTQWGFGSSKRRKHSGRVGRSAAAKTFDADNVRMAVIAHVRHGETPYDELLAQGMDRFDARAGVVEQIPAVLSQWE